MLRDDVAEFTREAVQLIKSVDWPAHCRKIIDPRKYPALKLVYLALAVVAFRAGVRDFGRPWSRFEDSWFVDFLIAFGCGTGFFFTPQLHDFFDLTTPENNSSDDRSNVVLNYASSACSTAVIFGIGALTIYFSYHWMIGTAASSGHQVGFYLIAITGGLIGILKEFAQRHGWQGYRPDDSPAVALYRAALIQGFGWFGFVTLMTGIGELTDPPPDTVSIRTDLVITFVVASVLGGFAAFVSAAHTAWRRQEYPLLAAAGALASGGVLGGFVGLVIIFCRAMAQTGHMEGSPWHNSYFIFGAAAGAALNVLRKFTRSPDQSIWIGVGNIIGFTAGAAVKGKAVVVGLWWVAVGVAAAGAGSFIAFSDVLSDLPAAIRWPLLVVVGAIGIYFAFARGLGPMLTALTGAPKLADEDLKYGRAGLAREDDAVKATRGGRR